MRMSLLLTTVLLVAGCGEVQTKPTPPAEGPKVQVVLDDKELAKLKRLLKDCQVAAIPEDVVDRPLEDVAVDLANSRKAALVECNKRLQKARAKLDGR